MHPTVPIDSRLVVALIAIFVAGIAKGVTGMGIPVVGVPILAALYGDLRLILPMTIVATTLSDVAMAWRWRRPLGEARILVPFAVAGLVGIVAGTQLLVRVRPQFLSALLACVVIAFVVVSLLGKMPTLERGAAGRWGAAIGLAAGAIQGSAGASGPIVTSYLLSMQLPRATFLFAINVIFAVLDVTQTASLGRLGLLHVASLGAVAVVTALALVGMWIGFAVHDRIDDRAFQRGVLVLLAVTAVGLLARAARA
ncbi:MAG: sulfite exporter TauE/SafE family protein [Candidatus Velthaea sp.]